MKNIDSLKSKIQAYTKVSDSDMQFGLQFYKEKKVSKGQHIIKPGQLARNFYFLKKGCVSFYAEDESGIKVMEFFTENTFFTDLYAYIEEIPSENYLEATEDCELFYISKSDILKSYNHSHELERFGRLSMQEAFIKTFQRTSDLKMLSNQERYLKLLEKRPDLLQRVPQYLIASYLGLTPVGLSKIRKRLSSPV
jgi:CRP-like cAMP-binding protein